MIRARTLATILAALAATSAAAAEVIEVYRTPVTTYYYTAPPTYYYTEPTARTYYYSEPAASYTEPATTTEIVVTAPRIQGDAAITDDVAYVIASDPRISGKIGVETYRNDVTLTGRVVTPGQADRAERDARSVAGVREVHSYLNTRVGR